MLAFNTNKLVSTRLAMIASWLMVVSSLPQACLKLLYIDVTINEWRIARESITELSDMIIKFPTRI